MCMQSHEALMVPLWNLGFNGIIYKYLLLMVTSFFTFEPHNKNPQKKYMQF